jgi:hypothetical protein
MLSGEPTALVEPVSFPRKREARGPASIVGEIWIPAFAEMTIGRIALKRILRQRRP